MPTQGGLRAALRSGFCIVMLPIGLIAKSAHACLLALIGADRRRIDRVYVAFANYCQWVAGTSVIVNGLDHAPADRAYVVVPNHESNWDPVVLIPALRQLSLRFVVKRQLMNVPIFGHALRLTGNVRVERTNTQRDVKRIREEMEGRSPEVSMIFYAEGTRSREGRFREFKRGAFATAIAYGLPVLPVGSAGTYAIWPPESVSFRKGAVAIEVGEPIEVVGLSLDDRKQLSDRTHAAVAALRARARARLRELGHEPGGVD